jgi:hypothetical protein
VAKALEAATSELAEEVVNSSWVATDSFVTALDPTPFNVLSAEFEAAKA